MAGQDHSPIRRFLRQITFGGNDGIITTFAIVAGFAGAQASGAAEIGTIAVLVFGMANLFADGVSMGLGEFLSDRSTRALYNSRAKHPVTAEEVSEVLVDQGLTQEDAQQAGHAIARAPAFATDVVLRHKYATEAPEGAAPLLRGVVTLGSFLMFGLIPILPYFIAPDGAWTFAVSVIGTVAALFLLGALRWRATDEPPLRAIGETVLLGTLCAALAYGAGNVVSGLG